MIRIALRAPFVSLTLIATLLTTGCAKSGPVSFRVLSSQDSAPIHRARIDVSYPLRSLFAPQSFFLVTDEQGHAERNVERAPRIDVQLDHPGYRPLTQSILVNDANSWTLHRDPTLIVSRHMRPASFEITRDEATGHVAIDIHLEWEARPAHIIMLPDNFRGLVMLTRNHEVPPLPEAPTPRVFTTIAAANGTAHIPAWPIEQAPYERFRFFTQSGRELPSTPSAPGALYVASLRESQDSVLFIVGDDHDETALRRALWIFATTGSTTLNQENYALLVEMMNASDSPVTGRDFAHALAN